MTNQIEVLSPETALIQAELRPNLTPVSLDCDHFGMVEELKKLDTDLRASRVESLAMRLACEGALELGAAQNENAVALHWQLGPPAPRRSRSGAREHTLRRGTGRVHPRPDRSKTSN